MVLYGDEALGVELPAAVELVIASSEPGVKGDTATGATKPATLETGLVVNVPLFMNPGDTIKVSTSDGRYLERTSDDISQLPFKVHDFGARGVSSAESSAIGGAAHLVSFMGSDTVLGVLAANAYYNAPMAAFSVPAAEHSTITAWGRDGEGDAYRNMLRQFGKPGAIVSTRAMKRMLWRSRSATACRN